MIPPDLYAYKALAELNLAGVFSKHTLEKLFTRGFFQKGTLKCLRLRDFSFVEEGKVVCPQNPLNLLASFAPPGQKFLTEKEAYELLHLPTGFHIFFTSDP